MQQTNASNSIGSHSSNANIKSRMYRFIVSNSNFFISNQISRIKFQFFIKAYFQITAKFTNTSH